MLICYNVTPKILISNNKNAILHCFVRKNIIKEIKRVNDEK